MDFISKVCSETQENFHLSIYKQRVWLSSAPKVPRGINWVLFIDLLSDLSFERNYRKLFAREFQLRN
ncbi:hypothetical protein GQ457_02G010950 [Hibiscus cannabinus]